jgi:SSS family transporter
MKKSFLFLLIGLFAALGCMSSLVAESERFTFTSQAAMPVDRQGFFLGVQDGTLFALGGMDAAGGISSDVYSLISDAIGWTPIGQLETARTSGAAVSVGSGVLLIGGETPEGPSAGVVKVSLAGGGLREEEWPSLPLALARPAATMLGDLIYVAGRAVGDDQLWVGVLNRSALEAGWRDVPSPSVAPGGPLVFASVQDRVFLFGSDGAASYLPRDGWRTLAGPPWWPAEPTGVSYGAAHILFPGTAVAGNSGMLLYHTHTGTWVESWEAPWEYRSPRVIRRAGEIVLVDREASATVGIVSTRTGFGWFDSAMIAIYLLGMVGMGLYFVRRKRNTADYFRGGNQLPWWAVGMSLFATGASAISLMSMPWKGFSENLTYLGISLYALIALPLAVFVIAPLVRRLAIVTPGHYMERRFGLGARLLAAGIFCFTQIGARMGAILLLPSIAISAVTGVPIVICILIMGFVTTIYTYLGGLSAVVWTDLVQGCVMVVAVVGCLVLALVRLDTPPADAWVALQAFDRMVVFDLRWDLTYPTAYLLFITTVVGTLMGISDQNFIQRVQATPNLRSTKIAVATQLAVAIPINILLFGLGLVLFLFYRERAGQLDPNMATDGIFPFFVAQELPVGISGLVIAALMAATMSTISSSICATANVATEDFFRRFRPNMTDRGTVVLGRYLTALVGLAGTVTALYLSQVDVGSIWDLAQMVINVIGNGIVGFFALGLLTRRAHQTGSMLGVVCGFSTILYLQNTTYISFWAFSFIGTVVTFVTGYIFSLIIPGGQGKDVSGLTVYSLSQARPENEAAAEHVGLGQLRTSAKGSRQDR